MLDGQIRPVQVTAGDSDSSDVELARHAGGHEFSVPIEHIEPGIGDRPTDGRQPGLVPGDGGRTSRVGCRLGRSIQVVDVLHLGLPVALINQ